MRTFSMRFFLGIVPLIALLSGCSSGGSSDMASMYERCVSDQIKAMNLMVDGYHEQSNQLFDQVSSQCQSKYPELEKQMNTTHYYKATNFEDMGNYAQALAEYEAYLAYPDRFLVLDEPATIGRALMKAKTDPANAAAHVSEAEGLLKKMSYTSAKYLVLKVNDAKYDLGIKNEQMLRSYLEALDYAKNSSADAYTRPIELATSLGQKKIASVLSKRQQDLRTVNAKAKAMNIPGPGTGQVGSEAGARRDAFYQQEFEKLGNDFFARYYSDLLESDLKILKMQADNAREYAELEQRNAEYKRQKDAEESESLSNLLSIASAGLAASSGVGQVTPASMAMKDPVDNDRALRVNECISSSSDSEGHFLLVNRCQDLVQVRYCFTGDFRKHVVDVLEGCARKFDNVYVEPGRSAKVQIPNVSNVQLHLVACKAGSLMDVPVINIQWQGSDFGGYCKKPEADNGTRRAGGVS